MKRCVCTIHFFPVCCSMDRVNKRSTLCSCVAFIISPWDAQQRMSRATRVHCTQQNEKYSQNENKHERKKKLFFFSSLYFENLHTAQQRHTALLLLLLTMVRFISDPYTPYTQAHIIIIVAKRPKLYTSTLARPHFHSASHSNQPAKQFS